MKITKQIGTIRWDLIEPLELSCPNDPQGLDLGGLFKMNVPYDIDDAIGMDMLKTRLTRAIRDRLHKEGITLYVDSDFLTHLPCHYPKHPKVLNKFKLNHDILLKWIQYRIVHVTKNQYNQIEEWLTRIGMWEGLVPC